jgi:hypothetical protein
MKKVFPITAKANQEAPGIINRKVTIHKDDGETIVLKKTFNNFAFQSKIKRSPNAR